MGKKTRIVTEYSWESGPKGVTEKFSVKIKHSRKSDWEELSPENHSGAPNGLQGIIFPTAQERRQLAISAASNFENIPSCPNLSRPRAHGACARDMQPAPKTLPAPEADFSEDDLTEQLTRALQGENPDHPDFAG